MIRKNNSNNMMPVAIIFVVVALLTLLSIFNAIEDLMSDNLNAKKMVISSGWDLSINDVGYKDVDLNNFKFRALKVGDKITLSINGISSDIEATVLLLKFKNVAIEVKQNGETLYVYGMNLYKEGKLTGSGFHRVNLHGLKETDTIEIDLLVTEKDAFSAIVPPEIRDGKTISYEITQDLLIPEAISHFFVVFAVCLIFVTVILAVMNAVEPIYLFKIFCIAVFSVAAGFWVFTSSNVVAFFTTNYSKKTFMEYFSLYLMPLIILSYQIDSNMKNVVGERREKVYSALWLADAVFIFYAVANHIMRQHSIVGYLIADHIISTVILLYIMITQIYDITRKKSKDYANAFGVLILVLAGLFEVIRYNVLKYVLEQEINYEFSVLFVAGLIFVWSLIADYVRSAIIFLKENARMEVVEKMAYTDSLTHIYNRMAAENRYRELEEENIPYCIIEFDMNGLKRINDTFGHGEGDEYIKSFAGALNDVFSKFGIVSRTGGDEFIVIIDEKNILEASHIRMYLGELKRVISRLNEWHDNWDLSVAYGYCFYNESEVMNVSDAVKKADERMYSMKKDMKKNKKKSKKEKDFKKK